MIFKCLILLFLTTFIKNSNGKSDDFFKRLRRDVTINQGLDNTYDLNAEKVVNIKDKTLSASAKVTGLTPGNGYETADAGFGILSSKGHSIRLSAEHNPKTGDTVAADAKLNLYKTDSISLDAKTNLEKFFPKSEVPVQTKFGGSLDYNDKNGKSASLSAHHDSTFGDTLAASGKASILNTDKHQLDASGTWSRQLPLGGGHKDTYSGSLDYFNKKPTSFLQQGSLSAQHIPDFGDTISASGRANLFHNENHNLDATGTISRTFPLDSSVKNYNTYQGNLDYLYRDKVGASLGVKHNDLFQSTDYSAMGKFNIFKDKNTDFNLQAGLQKHVEPFFSGRVEPSFGFQLEKKFK